MQIVTDRAGPDLSGVNIQQVDSKILEIPQLRPRLRIPAHVG
jgi:hypothetical protein